MQYESYLHVTLFPYELGRGLDHVGDVAHISTPETVVTFYLHESSDLVLSISMAWLLAFKEMNHHSLIWPEIIDRVVKALESYYVIIYLPICSTVLFHFGNNHSGVVMPIKISLTCSTYTALYMLHLGIQYIFRASTNSINAAKRGIQSN
ncbi:hypothetical protein HID58_070225 [Brassica napus]|uniref:Uncharacterized protein n=1 Tax=Brassica napus TaxID=3708 RepID=A0ABQ7YY78_BRANA|nr:hypothetical protein HID58_070225 [Brassica napus]